MEASSDTQPMSAGELKTRLYQTFRERGLVESLKSQLRTKLVTELRQSANLQHVKFASRPSAIISASIDGSSSLMLRAANSLVADHLRRCGYDYSIAVFLPESGAAEDKLFTVPDLLDLLRIAPSSQLYKRLAAELPRYDSKGFLWQLLTELSCGQAKKLEHVGIQVDAHPIHQSSIERKLQSVDDVYNQRTEEDEILNRHAIQEKLLKLKREMEIKAREETNREISRFKESALKRVTLEEREKARKEISSARREIENTYQAKSDALREREQATMERIQKHQELVERETYAQRQSLLDELRAIKQRETDTRRDAEINGRAAKMEEDKRKAMEENLRMREASVASIETTYDNKLKDETKRFELDYEARLTKRLRELEQREAKIRADQRSMSDEKETFNSIKEQLQGKANHILELENLLKEAKSEAASAANRSDLLNERMRTMVDYPSLKESNTILKRDLEHAKMRIAELGSDYKGEQSRHEELIKELSERMSRPSPELQALRSELQQAREQLSHEKATIQHMEAQWNARLQEEMETSKDLRHRLSEQTNEMTSLMRQLADLKLALRQTQTALNNNIYHADRSLGLGANDTMHNSALAEDIYMDTSLHRTTLGPELLLADSSRYQPPLDDSNSGEDSSESQGGDSIAFIEQTKARFRQLEREAEHLEHNYQDLQHRMSGVGAGAYQSPLFSASHTTGPTDVHMSRVPDQSSHIPLDGSRQVFRESPHVSPHSKQHPRKHTGSHKSKSGKERPADGRQRVPESSGTKNDGGGPRVSDHHHSDSRVSEKRSRSSSSSSTSSSISLRLKTSDLGGPDHKNDVMWMSPGATTAGAVGEVGPSSHTNDHSVPQASSEDEKKRARQEERKRRDQEEEERRRMEADRRRQEEEEEERRQREEDEKRRDEAGRIDADEEKRRMEEEEEEQRAWEEKRRQKEEERKKKDQEAREREQRMLMELQKQETSGGASPGASEPNQSKDHSAGLNDTYLLGDDGKKEEVEEKKKEQEEEDGVKIDPVMQRYMMMVQQRKQQQDTTPATQEPEVIPDSPSISHKSDGSISGEEMEGEMDGDVEDPASAGKASDNDDPFGDW